MLDTGAERQIRAEQARTGLYRKAVKEVLAGLPNEKGRRDDAAKSLDFYTGNFAAYSPRAAGKKGGPVRTSLFMQRCVKTLTKLLYKQGPVRKLTAPDGEPDADYEAASEWLEKVYRKNNVNALMQKADRLTHVSHVAAVQVEADADPDCPVKLRLWDASEIYAWSDPGEPAKAAVVAVLDKYDEQRRLRLYSADAVSTFVTKKLEPGQTSGGTAYTQVGPTVVNELGVLPFSFFHYEVPTCDFWTAGPGDHLRECNDWINRRLTAILDSCTANLDPILVVTNVRENWNMSAAEPGLVIYPPSALAGIDDKLMEPGFNYLQSDPSFVAAGWEDLNNGIDHELEMIGVPPSMIRMAETAARSGESIVAEQIEPVGAAQERQSVAEVAEDDLAKLVLLVGSRHLQTQTYDEYGGSNFGEYAATAEQLARVALKPGLMLRWPSLFPRMPGTATDTSDQWLLDNGLASRVTVLMERNGFTRQEAESYLRSVADDVKAEHELFGQADLAKAAVDGEKLKVMNAAQAESGQTPPADDAKSSPSPEPTVDE